MMPRNPCGGGLASSKVGVNTVKLVGPKFEIPVPQQA